MVAATFETTRASASERGQRRPRKGLTCHQCRREEQGESREKALRPAACVHGPLNQATFF